MAVKFRGYSVHGWQDFQCDFGLWHTEKSAVSACVCDRLTLAETGDFGGEFVCNLCAFSENRELHTKSALNN